MYALIINLKRNLGFITFESMRTFIPKLCDPNLKLVKLSPSYGVLLIVMFNHFGVPLHHFYGTVPKSIDSTFLNSCPPSFLVCSWFLFVLGSYPSSSLHLGLSSNLPDFDPFKFGATGDPMIPVSLVNTETPVILQNLLTIPLPVLTWSWIQTALYPLSANFLANWYLTKQFHMLILALQLPA